MHRSNTHSTQTQYIKDRGYYKMQDSCNNIWFIDALFRILRGNILRSFLSKNGQHQSMNYGITLLCCLNIKTERLDETTFNENNK